VESKAPALKALELAPNLAEAHVAMAGVSELEWDWGPAEREYKRAMELNPNSLDACGCYAVFLAGLGRPQEALALGERAVAVNPLSSTIQGIYGFVLYRARKYPEAEAHLRQAIELESQNQLAYAFLALVLEQEGRSSDAVALLERPEFRPSAALALAYAKANRRADALKMINTVASMKPNPDRYGTALAYFALGDKDRGIEWLTKAMDEREFVAPFARFETTLDDVRSDPKMQAQIARLKIPDPGGH
jgi:serine/threonine-protein kinase